MEKVFEKALLNSRYIVIVAVVASLLAATVTMFLATADVYYLLSHAIDYIDADLTDQARKVLRDQSVTHIVEVMDGYLLATVLLIFALGLYELFVSEIDEEVVGKAANVLFINSLDELKDRLAKVILMILIVKLFEHALQLHIESALDILYFGGAIALVGLALFLTKSKPEKKETT